ncbi:hypothetical protein AM231_15405 [Paenibacillus solani]|uniref:Uncharacterized protein n=2 Tax=Paenibacillus solani TaxID=1705565 RepID=A0A0M1P7K9_9BACL|nr:hypothetical protein AM231_15405 [Paenibacillus solani]
MKNNPRAILSNLKIDSNEIIESYLQLYSESSHNQYISSIADIFNVSRKNSVRDLTFDDYRSIYQKYNQDEKKTAQDSYKETFFKFLYANDLIDSKGFSDIWIKEDWIRYFLKKLNDADNNSDNHKENAKDDRSLSFSEILRIQEILDQE